MTKEYDKGEILVRFVAKPLLTFILYSILVWVVIYVIRQTKILVNLNTMIFASIALGGFILVASILLLKKAI
jgi:hypothetical protein